MKSVEVKCHGITLRLRRLSRRGLRRLYNGKVWTHCWLRAHTALPLCDGLYGVCFQRGHRRVQNTAYVQPEKNMVFLCDSCAEANEEYWNEMWREYYGGLL